MYEKFESNVYYYNQENYFIDKEYYLNKKWFSTYLYHPVIRKLLFYKYHFCSINDYSHINIESINYDGTIKYNDYRKHDELSNKKILNSTTVKTAPKIVDELSKYCPDIKKQQGYFYCDIFYRDKKMPSYYELLSMGDYCSFQENSINRQNYQTFMSVLANNILEMVVNGKLYREIHHINFYYSHYMGDIINHYLNEFINNEPMDDALDIDYFNTLLKESTTVQDIGYKNHLKKMTEEFIEFVLKTKGAKRCPICGQLFEYKKNKKYCSEDCKIKAKNQRYYKKNSQKIKIKYLEK